MEQWELPPRCPRPRVAHAVGLSSQACHLSHIATKPWEMTSVNGNSLNCKIHSNPHPELDTGAQTQNLRLYY